jgi:hypothetical protein
MSSRSELESLKYLNEKQLKLQKESQFHPPKVNEIPAAVLDTSLYSRIIEDEKKRREDVKAQRHELLLSMERPFEGLQERTNEQMERKKNRQKELIEKEQREHLEQKMKAMRNKKRMKAKADNDAAAAKKMLDEQHEKKLKRQAVREKLKNDVDAYRVKKLNDQNEKEENSVRSRFSFAPNIPESNIDAVLATPPSYEDPKTTKIKAKVNEARRQLYRARAARTKAEELVKREMRSTSHTSLAKAVLNKSGSSDSSGADPAGVNLSLLTKYRKALVEAKAKERECAKKVKKLEEQALKKGIDVMSLSEESKALVDGQQVFAFMTEEYKEDEQRRKQKGIERKARRAVNGDDMTQSQKMELARQKRMEEIVQKNGTGLSIRISKRAMLIDQIFTLLKLPSDTENEEKEEEGIR